MQGSSVMKESKVILEGIEAFPENIEILKAYQPPKDFLQHVDNPYYHGIKRPECLVVKFRREQTYDGHYLDIYKCLYHDKETCRCGMEWEYYQKGLYEHAN